MNTHPRRIRLKPWLINQVNSGQYSGLQWVDQQRKCFQIPWRHATRHVPTMEDEHTVFKAWAKETGKYQEGVDDPDPAKWKANLRCALNKSREFKLLYDGTKETPMKPFKIYEVCDVQSNGEPFLCEDYECVLDEEDELPHMMPKLHIDDRVPPSNLPTFPWSKQEIQYSNCANVTFAAQELCHSSLPSQSLVHTNPMMNFTAELQQQNITGSQGTLQMSELLPPNLSSQRSIHPGSGTLSQPSSMGSIHVGNLPPVELSPQHLPPVEVSPQQMEQFVPNLLISPHMLPLTDLEIKFQYRGKEAGSRTVSNPHGCRLYYSNLAPTPDKVELFGPVILEQVCFPSTNEIQNEKQRHYTEQLLDVMDRGLILEIQGQDIFAIRLCQCKVFWSGPSTATSCGPNPIEREKKIKLFSLETFLNELILYQKGQTGDPPPFEIYFCFGEEWPDKKPKEKKLIMVQVIPVAARILSEIFSGEMSWSADSIRLQISNPDLKDKMVEQFKELHQIWQAHHTQSQGQWSMQPESMQ